MFPIAGQTAGPIKLKFFHGQRRALQLVYYKIINFYSCLDFLNVIWFVFLAFIFCQKAKLLDL